MLLQSTPKLKKEAIAAVPEGLAVTRPGRRAETTGKIIALGALVLPVILRLTTGANPQAALVPLRTDGLPFVAGLTAI